MTHTIAKAESVDREARDQYLAIVVLGLGIFMAALDLTIVAPAFPVLQTEFHVSTRAIAWVIGIYALFNVVSQPTMAKLADMRGRRAIYLMDIVFFGTGSLVAALSPNFGILLVARALQGIGAGGIFPTANAIIGDTFPQERRGLAYGVTGSLWGMAAVIGPTLGGFLTQHVSWHWLFIINIPLAVIVFALGLRVLPGDAAHRKGALDLRGLIWLTLSVVGLMGALNGVRGDDFWGSLKNQEVLLAFFAFMWFAYLFIVTEREAESPVIPLSLYKHRDLRIADSLGVIAGIVESSLVFMPTLAVIVLGFSTEKSGYFLTPAALVLGFATPVVGIMLDRYGPRPVLVVGTIVTALGLFMLGTIAQQTWTFLLALIVGGIGLSSLLGTPLRYLTANAVGPENRATGMAVLSISTNIGIAIGAALTGAIISSQHATHPVASIHHAYIALGCITLAATLIAARIPAWTPAQRAAALAAAAERKERRAARRAARQTAKASPSSSMGDD
jgi:EmrB/QacA subfamily drug resistance transporter